jgi:hypothetical protein
MCYLRRWCCMMAALRFCGTYRQPQSDNGSVERLLICWRIGAGNFSSA